MNYEIVNTKKQNIIYCDGNPINPPKSKKDERILKKAGEEITFSQLGEYLELISWGLKHRGCGIHYLTNQYGELTQYCARRCNKKNPKTDKWNLDSVTVQIEDLGGENGNSTIYLSLIDCFIELHEGTIFIYSEKNHGVCVHFYNFDDPLTPEEELIETFPKDYEIKLKCTRCGHCITRSKPLSAYKIYSDWTMLVMGRGFSTPSCPKCNENTFGDLNISTDMVFKRISTGGNVKVDTIFKEAKSKYVNQVMELIRE